MHEFGYHVKWKIGLTMKHFMLDFQIRQIYWSNHTKQIWYYG